MIDYKKIKPLGNRMLVRRDQATTAQGKILLPDSAQEKPKQGEVLALGPGKMDKQGTVTPMSLNVGDQVLFGSFAGTEVETSDTEEFLVMSEEDILAIVN